LRLALSALTKRLKRAAHRERARRYLAMYVVSAIVLLVLLAPFVLLFLFWGK
jgi:hypothetical protein